MTKQQRIQETQLARPSVLNADEIVSVSGSPHGPLRYVPSLSR
jgi:hypothetical protein